MREGCEGVCGGMCGGDMRVGCEGVCGGSVEGALRVGCSVKRACVQKEGRRVDGEGKKVMRGREETARDL